MPIHNEFYETIRVSRPEIDRFNKDGFIHMRSVLTPRTFAYIETTITAEVRSRMAPVSSSQEQTTYQKAFKQNMNLLTLNEVVKEFAEGRSLPISDDSEARLQTLLTGQGFDLIEEPFALGDMSFHSGWTYHRAGSNSTDTARKLMTVICMDAEMRLKHPENDFQNADWQAWCPGAVPGEPIRTPLNPVLHTRS